MSDSSTLQVVVDAAPAEAGASRVKNAISSMSSRATSALNSLSSSFERMQSFLSKSNAGLTAFFAAIGAGYVLKSFLDRLIEVNTTFNAFIATMNVVTGSVAKSNAEYQYLLAFSNKIGVSIESVTKQYGRLAASMKSVDETGEMTRHVFEAISEASTVLHLKGHETNLLFMALEQSASKGKVSLEEFQRQLANKLPDAMGLASRAMSMTQAEFRDAVTKGSLNVYEVLIKLSNQIKKEYGESAEYAANQFTGKLNIMKNNVFELYRVIGQSGAMDGLTKIITTITDKLGDSSLGKTIGDSLGTLFGQLADWLSKITQSDVQDFFLGLSWIIQSFTAIMRELVGAFSQTVDGKSDFIGFGETVAKMMLVMTDAAMTFLAVIMQLPLSINVVIQDVNVMLAGLKGIKDWATDGLDAAANNINAAKAERNKALALANTNLAIVLGSDDSPTAKAWKKTNEIFANMRKQKAAMEADNKSLAGKTQIDIRPKTEAEMANMMKGLPPVPAKPNKGMGMGMESAYEKERVKLFKTAGVAELEYTNIMEGRLKTEGKNRTELEAKMRFDKDYIAMSKAQKAELLSMADAADKATAKRVAAEQFQSDILSMNKAIYQSEMDLMDIANDRNPVEEKNLRQFEEKLKFDSKYLAMSDQMIAAEREKAKAADALAVSVERARGRKKMKFDATEGIDQMKFEMAMQGQTAEAVRRATEARKIEIEIKKLSAGATGEELLKYQELEQFLKGQMSNTLDEFYAKQSSLTEGLRDGISKYLDQLSDVSGKVSGAVQRSFGAMEDMLTNFFMTGKLNFKDFIKVILGELVKLMIQLLIIKPLMAMFGGAFGGGAAAAGGATTMAGSASISMMAAKGAAFHDGGVQMFASGGAFANRIVNKPTSFPIGIMGEAGPEAIMPLGKDAQGRLGIRVSGDQGGGNIENNVTIAVSIQDGQVKDGGESGNQLGDKLKAVVIGVLTDELRPGGILAKN